MIRTGLLKFRSFSAVNSSMESLTPQQVMHYVVAEKIGQGATGEVYRAWDNVLERFVALKFLPVDLMKHQSYRAQCLAAMRELTAIDHPNIATIYGVHKVDERFVIAMEFIEGHSLGAKLKDGPLGNDTLLDIARQVAAALDAAHQRRVIHGNINPANIFVNTDRSVRVLDFGLSTLPVEREDSTFLPGMAAIRYRSPEQITGEEVTPLTDLFSAGVVFYEALAGTALFIGDDQSEAEDAILHFDPDLNALHECGAIRGGTVLALEKLLAKDTVDRFQNAAEMKVTLDAMLTFEQSDKVREFLDVKPTSSRQYLMLSLLAVMLIIFWLVITTVTR